MTAFVQVTQRNEPDAPNVTMLVGVPYIVAVYRRRDGSAVITLGGPNVHGSAGIALLESYEQVCETIAIALREEAERA